VAYLRCPSEQTPVVVVVNHRIVNLNQALPYPPNQIVGLGVTSMQFADTWVVRMWPRSPAMFHKTNGCGHGLLLLGHIDISMTRRICGLPGHTKSPVVPLQGTV